MGSFSMGWDAPRDPSHLTDSMEALASAGILEKSLALSHSCVPSISNQAGKAFLVSGPTTEHKELIPGKRETEKPAWETPARHQPGGATRLRWHRGDTPRQGCWSRS